MGIYIPKYPKIIEKQCKVCSIVFLDSSPRKHALCCSVACYNKINNKTEDQRTKACTFCGLFFVDKAYANNSCFCSKECSQKHLPNRLKHSLRSRLNHAINKNLKTGSAVDDLGCSVEFFVKYIESKWQEGMSWDNWARDGWHIDHIVALQHFNLTDKEQLKKAAHYTNLQPLWSLENSAKDPKRKKDEQK